MNDDVAAAGATPAATTPGHGGHRPKDLRELLATAMKGAMRAREYDPHAPGGGDAAAGGDVYVAAESATQVYRDIASLAPPAMAEAMAEAARQDAACPTGGCTHMVGRPMARGAVVAALRREGLLDPAAEIEAAPPRAFVVLLYTARHGVAVSQAEVPPEMLARVRAGAPPGDPSPEDKPS